MTNRIKIVEQYVHRVISGLILDLALPTIYVHVDVVTDSAANMKRK